MKKLVFFFIVALIFSCSTEKEKMEAVKSLAKEDLIIQLQLPEGTSFNEKDFVITEVPDYEGIGVNYQVNVEITSEDKNGNKIVKKHTLTYVKIGEEGLSPDDYELKSFD